MHFYLILLSVVASQDLNIVLHYLINGTVFGKGVTEHEMCVLIFSTTYVANMSHSKENWVTYYNKCTSVFT